MPRITHLPKVELGTVGFLWRDWITQKRDQNMGIDSMLQLVIDRPNAQVTFQTLERRFHLHQLHVPIPQHRRVFRYQIRSEQIMPIAQLSIPQLGFVNLERERLACHRLAGWRQLDLHVSESATSFGLRRAHPVREREIAVRQAIGASRARLI